MCRGRTRRSKNRRRAEGARAPKRRNNVADPVPTLTGKALAPVESEDIGFAALQQGGDAIFRRLVEGVRDYAIFMLDARRPHRDVERRRRAHQGLRRRRDHRPALLDVLPAGGARPRLARATSCGARPSRAASRTKAGACARTARASGPTSSSPRCARRTGELLGFRRSRATSPSGASTRRRCAADEETVPPAGRGRAGLRHLHARPARAS